jgi:hypothetical protein
MSEVQLNDAKRVNQEAAELRTKYEALRQAAEEMAKALKDIDDSWSSEGWTPENAKARTQFTDDTIARWVAIRAALAKWEATK